MSILLVTFMFNHKSITFFNKVLYLIILFSYCFGTSLISKAGEGPNVLMFGATLNDLSPQEREYYTEFNVIERPFIATDKIKDLIKQVNPVKVIIRQPSGGIYEYSAKGNLQKQLEMYNPKQATMDKQSHCSGNPTEIGGKPKETPPEKSDGKPVYINSPAVYINGVQNQQNNQSQTEQGMRGMPPSSMPMNMMPYGPAMMNSPMPYPPRPMFGPWGARNSAPPPYLPSPCPPPFPMPYPNASPSYGQPQIFNPTPNRGVFNQLPPNLSVSQSQNNMALNNNAQAPFPGANVPNYLYPGRSEYSYLPGEGDIAPLPGLSTERRVIKQLAGLAQNTAYPFWFDNYLTTNSSTLDSLTANVGTNAGLPATQFNANTTANSAIVIGQLLSTGIGVGSTIADATLDGRYLRTKRRAAVDQANGTPYYYYPDAAWSYYQSMPYQPVPSGPNR